MHRSKIRPPSRYGRNRGGSSTMGGGCSRKPLIRGKINCLRRPQHQYNVIRPRFQKSVPEIRLRIPCPASGGSFSRLFWNRVEEEVGDEESDVGVRRPADQVDVGQNNHLVSLIGIDGEAVVDAFISAGVCRCRCSASAGSPERGRRHTRPRRSSEASPPG